jgi:hypothetical protein
MWSKNIYQTYECDFDELHESFKQCCNLWKSTYPDWDYHFRNSEERREDVIRILCLEPDETRIYDAHRGITQSDIWRYAVTAFNGGMYADLDSIPISKIEPILDELDENIELVALPDGEQRAGLPGSNNCNFILKAKSEIAMSLLSSIKEYFHKCDKKLNNNLRTTQLDFTELFAKATVLHKSKVAQIFDSKYVSHSLDFKPPDEYRSKYEKKIHNNLSKGAHFYYGNK